MHAMVALIIVNDIIVLVIQWVVLLRGLLTICIMGIIRQLRNNNRLVLRLLVLLLYII